MRVQPEGDRHAGVRGPAADRRVQPGPLSPGRQRQPAPALPARRRGAPPARPRRGGAQLHPVHGGFRCDDAALYPAYQVLEERGVPLVVHCGTSSFPGAANENADPAYLIPVVRDFPGLNVVLAHGGRGWWYDAAAFLALSQETVWLELSGLPPKRLPEYYAKFDLGRLARKWIFGTDWPGVPGIATNARAVAELLPDDAARAVLAGNAMKVYAGLHQER
ncbi:amidohydrolase family protein [Thermocatellispora tengchongensis]|uniref:amidohydrolase family protein n=1 Tax=Thermocatellispora tengchongensis TaxID=1073253 RepID=UPI00362B5248